MYVVCYRWTFDDEARMREAFISGSTKLVFVPMQLESDPAAAVAAALRMSAEHRGLEFGVGAAPPGVNLSEVPPAITFVNGRLTKSESWTFTVVWMNVHNEHVHREGKVAKDGDARKRTSLFIQGPSGARTISTSVGRNTLVRTVLSRLDIAVKLDASWPDSAAIRVDNVGDVTVGALLRAQSPDTRGILYAVKLPSEQAGVTFEGAPKSETESDFVDDLDLDEGEDEDEGVTTDEYEDEDEDEDEGVMTDEDVYDIAERGVQTVPPSPREAKTGDDDDDGTLLSDLNRVESEIEDFLSKFA